MGGDLTGDFHEPSVESHRRAKERRAHLESAKARYKEGRSTQEVILTGLKMSLSEKELFREEKERLRREKLDRAKLRKQNEVVG